MAQTKMNSALTELIELSTNCESRVMAVFDEIQTQSRMLHPDWERNLKGARLTLISTLKHFNNQGVLARDVLHSFLSALYPHTAKVVALLKTKYAKVEFNYNPLGFNGRRRGNFRGGRGGNRGGQNSCRGNGRSGYQGNTNYNGAQQNVKACFFCHDPNHFKNDCPKYAEFVKNKK